MQATVDLIVGDSQPALGLVLGVDDPQLALLGGCAQLLLHPDLGIPAQPGQLGGQLLFGLVPAEALDLTHALRLADGLRGDAGRLVAGTIR